MNVSEKRERKLPLCQSLRKKFTFREDGPWTPFPDWRSTKEFGNRF